MTPYEKFYGNLFIAGLIVVFLGLLLLFSLSNI